MPRSRTPRRPAALRVDHLAFPSFDVAATHRFYTEVMGFRLSSAFDGTSPEWGNRRYLMANFIRGRTYVTFFALDGMARPKGDGLPRDIRHVALAAGSKREVAAWRRHLTRHGVAYTEEDHDGDPSLYFSDPNGVMLEITYHRPERFERKAAAEALKVVKRWGRDA